MDPNDFKNYLNYLGDVLGIKQIVTTHAAVSSTPLQLLISVSDLSSYTLDETALLEKMITALQLGSISYRVQDDKDAKTPAAYHLVFADEIFEFVTSSQNTTITFSPRKLLRDPNLKKQAWSEMQILLQKIKNP